MPQCGGVGNAGDETNHELTDNKMNRLITLLAAAMLATGAMAQDANRSHYISLLTPRTGTNGITGTGVDVSAYKGNARLLAVFADSTSAAYTGTVTFAHSDDGTNYVTITNTAGLPCVITATGAFTNTVIPGMSLDSRRLRRYMRATATQTASNEVTAAVVFPMR